jgi:hypothetical protein
VIFLNQPDVITEWHDEKINFTLQVFAYRKVTNEELSQALAYWLHSQHRKKLPQNTIAKVITIHGFHD